MDLLNRANALWEFAGAELGKHYEYNTNYTICLVLAAVVLDIYDSGIVPDSDGANGPENTNTPERDIVAAIDRLTREGWK